MKKILLICEPYGRGGGVKKYLDNLIHSKNEFDQCHFIFLLSQSSASKNANKQDKDIIYFKDLSFKSSVIKLIRSIYEIHRIVKNRKIGIIHGNSTYSGILIYIYSFINRRIKFIYTPHGYYSLNPNKSLLNKLYKCVEKKINSKCDVVIHVSKSEENYAIRNNLVPKDRSVIINNGTKDPHYEKNHGKKSCFYIVNIARVDAQKNPFEFIEVAKKVILKNHQVNFIWAGNGSSLDAARKRVKEYGLDNHVEFIGFSNKIPELLKQADLFFSTSLYEGLPFSVIEGMSYKLPVILSDVIGHSDMVNEGVNGYLYNLGDITDAATKINELLKSDILCKLGVGSYKLYREEYSVRAMNNSLNGLYNSIS